MKKGYGVSPGIAIGNVLIKEEFKYEIKKELVDDENKEVDRFDQAVKKCKKETEKLYEKMLKTSGEQEAQIFKAHLMILEDPEFIDAVKNDIKNNQFNAEYALDEIANKFIKMFENMDNEYLRERALDIRDIRERLLKILVGHTDLANADLDNQIIIAKELTPSDTAKLDLEKVKGFITETGGKTSHTAIMAKSLEIPAIVGAGELIKDVKNADEIVMDGDQGELFINPDEETKKLFEEKLKKYNDFRNKLNQYIGQKTVTKDNIKVELASNIGTLEDLDGVLKNDSEGIGLFRTEFLYMNSDHMPTEEEQFKIYKEVGQKMDGKPIIIRTLDIGGDKELPYYEFPEEMNPFLGYRAIRMCLDDLQVFKTQLRAILRASAFGNIKIMFPMISSLEELLEAKKIVEEVKEELILEKIEFDKNISIGMMIEVPSAAIISDILAKHVDFFSIGTNDLIQYTVAVDRMNEKIKDLYTQFHPAILRLIKMVIDNGHKNDIWVGMCGEVAGDKNLIPLLLGMGLDEFSMSSINVLQARYLINNLSKSEMETHVEDVLALSTAEEVKSYMLNLKKEYDLEV